MQHATRPTRPAIIHMRPSKRAVACLLGWAATALRALNSVGRWFSRNNASPAVLVLEPFGLGDVITFEPMLRTLLAHHREVRVCASPAWQTLFDPRITWVPAQVPWASHAADAKYVFARYLSKSFRQFLRDLRRAGRGAIGVDTRGDVRSVLLLHLAGCRQVITLSTYLGTDMHMAGAVGKRVPIDLSLRRWELNLRFLPALGVAAVNVTGPSFPRAIQSPRSRGQAALIPIAPWKGKWWEPAKWTKLIAQLQDGGWSVKALCGPGQSQAVRSQVGDTLPLQECRAVAEWVDALSECDLVITLDTGPMHLADALGVRVVALFGQSLLPLWAPSAAGSCVVTHQTDPDFVPCPPADAHTAQGQEFMRRITVEEVMQAVGNVPRQT